MANGPRFSTGSEGTPLSELKMGRDTPMTQEEIRRGPSSPKPRKSYKLSVRDGKINLSPVRKTTGRNIVSNTEIETFASSVLPEGGKEKETPTPRLGGYLPEEDVSQERRTGYRMIDPPVDRQALRPTPERRTGISQSQAMDNRGGSGLQPNNNTYVPNRRLPSSPTMPDRSKPISMPPMPDRIEGPPPRPVNLRSIKEVSPDTGGFEPGMSFYGGGKVHSKKKKKKMYGGKMKKYAKGGGIRKPKYS